MAKKSGANGLVGLGDNDFDSLLYSSQEVDFDFFDESTAPEPPAPASQKVANFTADDKDKTDVTQPRQESLLQPMEPPLDPKIFSTASLLASLSALSQPNSDEDVHSVSEDDDAETKAKAKSTTHKRLFNGHANGHHGNVVPARVRLFDISDSSTDDEDQVSQPHMTMTGIATTATLSTAFLKEHNGDNSIDEDNYLTDDSNFSDITDVTPISSLGCSPMPSPCGTKLHDDIEEDDYELKDWYEGDIDVDDHSGPEENTPMQQHLQQLRSCGQGQQLGLGPLHLDVMEPGTPTQGSSFLLMQSSPNLANNGHPMNSTSPLQWQRQQLMEFAGPIVDESLMNYRNGLCAQSDIDDLVPGFTTTTSLSPRSSASGCFGSSYSNSMSIPSCTATTTSSSTHKVFGHSRLSNSKASRCSKTTHTNHSFSKDETRRIERENQILLRKIVDTQKRKHHHHQGGHGGSAGGAGGNGNQLRVKPQLAHLSFRAKQHQRRIDYENAILLHKIQTVKPSTEIRVAFSPTQPSPTSKVTRTMTNGHGSGGCGGGVGGH